MARKTKMKRVAKRAKSPRFGKSRAGKVRKPGRAKRKVYVIHKHERGEGSTILLVTTNKARAQSMLVSEGVDLVTVTPMTVGVLDMRATHEREPEPEAAPAPAAQEPAPEPAKLGEEPAPSPEGATLVATTTPEPAAPAIEESR